MQFHTDKTYIIYVLLSKKDGKHYVGLCGITLNKGFIQHGQTER